MFNDDSQKVLDKYPKMSNTAINITTPENKTYTEPMSGYYPATYGFENDAVSTFPEGWEIYKINGHAKIISEKGVHKKVLELYDNLSQSMETTKLYNDLGYRDSGTIELWIQQDNLEHSDHRGQLSAKGNNNTIFWLRTIGGSDPRWQILDGGSFVDISGAPIPSIDTWYHIRIDFEHTTGGYHGLGENEYYIYIDGNRYGPYNFGANEQIEELYLHTYSWGGFYHVYFDAVSYSWDSNYDIGDNYNEGLLLSFTNNTVLDWIGYSLDSQTNKTIFGDSAIPFPLEDGLHTVQVFGNDTIGTNYQSDIRFFSLRHINIITPENKTYTRPMSGYYPSTYGFENDEDGNVPEEWYDATGTWYNITGSTVNVYAEVIHNLDRHNKIVEMYDTVNDKFAAIGMNFSSQSYGTIELWIRSTDVSKKTQITLLQLSGTAFGLAMTDDEWQARNGNSLQKAVGGAMPTTVDNTWYHVTIHFECTTGGFQGLEQYQWKCVIDGIESASENFYQNRDSIDMIRIQTNEAATGYTSYADAVGFSWDNDYSLGENLNEGLLLSFETSFSANWTGYSLDGQINRTISGNTTFSYPIAEGRHNIQLFGNNSLGEIFESDIRYFTIKYFPINIITPENITYTEPMSGYYPATYGFESDEIGHLPQEWIELGPVSSDSVEVLTELDGHKRVIDIYKGDTYGSDHNLDQDFIENQEFGEIEFWTRASTLTAAISVMNSTIPIIGINLQGASELAPDVFGYHDNTGWHDTNKNANPNQWYHIKVQFECGNGNHYGLPQYKWRFFVDGERFGDFSFLNNQNTVNKLRFHQNWRYSFFHHYIDAVGYSWDPDYTTKDNLYEGLLLSYMNRTNLDWIGYSLDDQPNKTIIGNTVIPLNGNGGHNIKLYGTNSTDFTFESPVQYFTIDILTPQILINSPQSYDYFGFSAPNFDISITTPILDTIWYTLDNGITKIVSNVFLGTIDQSEWDKFGQGLVTIRFYVNDTFGQENFSEVTIYKDLNTPITPLYNSLIFLILISVGITIVNLIVIRKVRRKKHASEIVIRREEIVTNQQLVRCPYCQKKLNAIHVFCIHCGSKLKY